MFPIQSLQLGLLSLLAFVLSAHSFLPSIHPSVPSTWATSSSKRTIRFSSISNNEINVNDKVDNSLVSRRQVMSRIASGFAAVSLTTCNADKVKAEVAAKVTVSSQAEVSLEAKTQSAPAPPPSNVPVSTDAKTVTKSSGSSKLENPGDVKNCSDFANYKDAKAWFDKYYELYGDVAKLDKNNNLIPCEALPGAPKPSK